MQSIGHMENKSYSEGSPQVYKFRDKRVSVLATSQAVSSGPLPRKSRQRFINGGSIQDANPFESSDCQAAS